MQSVALGGAFADAYKGGVMEERAGNWEHIGGRTSGIFL